MMKKFQFKFVRLLLLTSTVPLVVLALFAVTLLHALAMKEARYNLDSRLATALTVYTRSLDELRYDVRDMNRRVFTLLEEEQNDLLLNELESLSRRKGFDFFEISDRWGSVILSAGRKEREGADISTDPFVIGALSGKPVVSLQKVKAEELRAMGLEDKARFQGSGQGYGLLVKASIPLINSNEIIIGTMSAGFLLNNGGILMLESISSATGSSALIAMNDTVLCSTLPETGILKKTGSVSSENFSGVKYIVRYAGLNDLSSRTVAELGIGIPEKDVFATRNSILRLFAIAVLFSVVLSFLFGIIKGRSIVKSVRKLRKGIEAFGKGNLEYRVEIESDDELQELAEFLNATVAQLRTTRQQLETCSLNVQQLENTISRNTLELEQAQKKIISFERMAAIGRMAAALSHELRNVFTGIGAGTEVVKAVLKSSGRSNKATKEAVVEIERGLAKASEILERVLFFTYQQKPVFSRVDINYIMDQLLERNRELLEKEDVTVIKNRDVNLPEIEADGPQVREALNNLLVNAIQSMSGISESKLTISTEQVETNIRVMISDTGCGIPEDILANLFTPFVTTKRRGLGIGLCVSQSIIEAHGGTVQVASKQGRGSTFAVMLPISRAKSDTVKEGAYVEGREHTGS